VSIWTIVLKGLSERRLSALLTAASVALGVGVTVAVLALREQSREGFGQDDYGIDLVVGPRSGALQLVLNTIYHMDASPGNVPWATVEALSAHKGVSRVLPLAVGDAYRGARIVGTLPGYFDLEVRPGRPYEIEGRAFRSDPALLRHLMEQERHDHAHEGAFEAVVGAAAAKATGLRIGDRFRAAHGVEAEGEAHEEEWTVTGVLRPTGTPNDRAIFISLESFFSIREHERRPEVSAVLVKTRGPGTALQLRHDLNREPGVMAVVPAQVMAEFFEKFDWIPRLFLAVAALVILVAAVSVFVAIMNSMSERRRMIAILRALGARRSTVFSIILLEAGLICAAGAAAGLLIGHGLAAGAGAWMASKSGAGVPLLVFRPEELLVVAGVTALGLLAGLLPAIRAYRVEIGEGLSPS
jgi:putative ABC transport system permease protein